MGVLDKIKNALFEVEYVEVEDKKEKKRAAKEQADEQNEAEKPIAKKIVLPGKKEEKVQEIQEEELKDEDFEIRPKDEKVKEVFQDNFNVMDDDPVENVPAPVPPVAAPPVEVPQEVVVEPVTENSSVDITPLVEPSAVQAIPVYRENNYTEKDYVREYDSSKEKVYNTINTIYNDYRVKTKESKPYGMDPSYHVSIKEYGSVSRDEKGNFRPSPILSPIYGILDKNYRKEDVVSKRDVHSSYAKTNANVDDVRDKAYGSKEEEEIPEVPKTRPAFLEPVEKNEEDENLLVDLTDEKKPELKEITVGDAMEYYHDLGLEYNVDYVDASGKNQPQPSDDLEKDIKDTMDNSDEEPVMEKTMDIPVEEINTQPVVEEKEEIPVVEEVKEDHPEKESTLDDDDNLFDLIDSMYKEEEK